MFHKILIANRGEIACRIIKTARKMGIKTVAIYSKADENSLHVTLADYAYCVGEPPAKDSYLNIENIIQIAKEAAVDAIHPGYGFLSESPQFAKICEQENIIFIGPSVSAMEAMASKQLAKQILEKTKVPLTPGFHGKDQSDHVLLKEAEKLGFPVLLKAANGGGGKGMRSVTKLEDFNNALAGARREAMASFADDTMLIEKLIEEPRHIEVQIIADNHGNVLHLFERDCSIQRRHQKIIEEAPACNIDEKLRKNLALAAIEVAKTIQYIGAGTIEFLVDKKQNFYFMEMNTRLQVEHPVTEMITNLDLVELQIRVAAGERLPLKQDQIRSIGHAIECRIYAEDPTNNFMPSIGKITYLNHKEQEGVRIDSGITCNSMISRYYDPMLAKIIAFGENREQARLRLINALENYHIAGIKNNLVFLQTILNNKTFIANKITTNFLIDEKITIKKPNLIQAAQIGASLDYLKKYITTDHLKKDTFAFQMHLSSHWTRKYLIEGEEFSVSITPISLDEFAISVVDISQTIDTIKLKITVNQEFNKLIYNNGLLIQEFLFKKNDDKATLFTSQGTIEIFPYNWQKTTENLDCANSQLTAPMPGTIVAIFKKANDLIKIGEPLMVIEAMKMEHTILAPSNGIISSIFYDIGAQVKEGATLVAMEKA